MTIINANNRTCTIILHCLTMLAFIEPI